MPFSSDFTERVRGKIELVDLVRKSIKLKRVGANFVGLCPFHNEKSPSLNVSPSKQMFHCFGCGKHGDAFRWVMDIEHVSFPEAVKRLADIAGVHLEKPMPDRRSRKAQPKAAKEPVEDGVEDGQEHQTQPQKEGLEDEFGLPGVEGSPGSTSTESPEVTEDVDAPPPSLPEKADKTSEVLAAFVAGARLTVADKSYGEEISRKRGLTPFSQEALGLMANSPGHNKPLLDGLRDRFTNEELVRSWLFQRKGEVSGETPETAGETPALLFPDMQFYGRGRTGRKVQDDRGQWVEEWEDPKYPERWSCPPLIPYCDEAGAVVGLRPHKGGAKGVAPRLYVPRATQVFRELHPELAKWWAEQFNVVVITEGEFKAAALWQMVGAGWRQFNDRKVVGVCALPGIQQGNNSHLRMDLECWLTEVEAQKVIIVFDNEEKGDPKLASFKPDESKRWDSIIWGKWLAKSLGRSLSLKTRFAVLPAAWRDENGKADWDGALARLIVNQ